MELKPSTEFNYVRMPKGEAQVLKLFEQSELVAVDFYAEWCPPCKMLKPVLIRESEAAKNFMLACINVQQEGNSDIMSKFNLSSIPAVFLCQKSLGNVIFKFIGNNVEKLKEMIAVSYSVLGRQPQEPKLRNKQNSYQCDLCKNVGIASEAKRMLHCTICNFDICHNCSHE